MIDLGQGMADMARGTQWIAARPRLWIWVLAPAALALGVLVIMLGGALAVTAPARAWMVSMLPDMLASMAAGLLGIILTAVFAMGGYALFFALVMLLSAPFNEQLSEAVEREVTGHTPTSFAFSAAVVETTVELMRGIGHALRRVATYALIMGGLLLASLLVPLLGQLAYIAIGAVISARFAAFDAYDAVWARKRWRYRDKIAYLHNNRARSYGLGAAITLLMAVPVLNTFALSAAAVGATLAYLDTSSGA